MACADINRVIQCLDNSGYESVAAWPGRMLPHSNAPYLVVGLKAAAEPAGKRVLEVKVLCNISLGGALCSETALNVAKILSREGYACSVGSMDFDGETGHLVMSVTAAAPMPLPVKIGATSLGKVTDFSAQWDNEDGIWTVRIEEFFPNGYTEVTWPAAPYSVICRTDAYHNCSPVKKSREAVPGGWKQITTCTSNKRTVL